MSLNLYQHGIKLLLLSLTCYSFLTIDNKSLTLTHDQGMRNSGFDVQ